MNGRIDYEMFVSNKSVNLIMLDKMGTSKGITKKDYTKYRQTKDLKKNDLPRVDE